MHNNGMETMVGAKKNQKKSSEKGADRREKAMQHANGSDGKALVNHRNAKAKPKRVQESLRKHKNNLTHT